MTLYGMIVAGGRATRLGPLTASMNKALVSVGQRPIISHQIELLVDAGCDEIIVVVPKDDHVVEDVVYRTWAHILPVYIARQEYPLGPVDAIHTGTLDGTAGSDVVVLFADTYLTELPLTQGRWVAVAESNQQERSFCFYHPIQETWFDDKFHGSQPVFVGALRWNVDELREVSTKLLLTPWKDEVGMAALFNKLPNSNFWTWRLPNDVWHDCGDTVALVQAKRQVLRSRPHHRLELTLDNTIQKHGADSQERTKARTLSNCSTLVPQFIAEREAGYETEFVDLPSLAELMLYWPAPVETWQHCLEHILSRVDLQLWRRDRVTARDEEALKHASYSMLIGKLMDRATIDDTGLVKDLVTALTDIGDNVITAWLLHGDMNFNNILYSLSTDVFYLIDPRGEYAAAGLSGDVRYDLAKLWYSYHGFMQVCHGLVKGTEIPPFPAAEALDDVLGRWAPLQEIRLIGCSIMLSAGPLHDDKQRDHLNAIGTELTKEVLK